MSNQTVLYTTLSSFEVTPLYFTINMLTLVAAVVALVLNAGIIYIFFVEKDLAEDGSAIPIKHLAVSDLFCAMMILYTVIYNLVHYKLFIECILRFGLLNGISLNSAMITLVLTVDRYVKIISPYKYVRYFTQKSISKTLMINWFFCIPVCLLPVVGWHNQVSSNHCSYFGIFTPIYLRAYALLIILTVFMMTVMYVHIITIAISQGRNTLFQKGALVARRIHRSIWWRPTKTTLIIVGTNMFCLVPPVVYILVASSGLLDWSSGEKGTVLVFSCSLSYLNIIVNPIIYASRIQRIKQFVRKALKLSDVKDFISDYQPDIPNARQR